MIAYVLQMNFQLNLNLCLVLHSGTRYADKVQGTVAEFDNRLRFVIFSNFHFLTDNLTGRQTPLCTVSFPSFVVYRKLFVFVI